MKNCSFLSIYKKKWLTNLFKEDLDINKIDYSISIFEVDKLLLEVVAVYLV